MLVVEARMPGRGFTRTRELADRVGGTVFFIGFGTAWVLLSSIWLGWVRVWSGVLIGVCGALLFAWAWRFSARLERMAGPASPMVTPDSVAAARAFKWANTGQYVAMFVVSAGLVLLRRPEWIMAAIGIIVGLHLLPLAHWFHNPTHYVTAALLVGWSAGLIIRLPRAETPGWAALGTGLILLGSACMTLLRSLVGARRLETRSAIGESA